ncbi:MAG: SDR family NAD(P)-dependent oxidoreductase [Pseudomonadales bacterium]
MSEKNTKAVFVSGANKGIGLAIVEAILSEHEQCLVILGSRDQGRGDCAKEQLLEQNPAWASRLMTVQIDVGDSDSVEQAAKQVLQLLQLHSSELIGVVNNAGIAHGGRAEMMAVNVYGIRNVLTHFLALASETTRFVNVTSASGPNYVADCTSKWQNFFLDENTDWSALDAHMQEWIAVSDEELVSMGLPTGYDYGLSKACANLLTLIAARENPHMSINACTPGFIDTDLTRPMLDASNRTAAELGMKLPADGARVVMHLLFDAQRTSAYYYGSDSQRSPMDSYRAPGSPPYSPPASSVSSSAQKGD